MLSGEQPDTPSLELSRLHDGSVVLVRGVEGPKLQPMFRLPFCSSVFPLPPQRPTVNHSVPPVNDLGKIFSTQTPWSATYGPNFPKSSPLSPRIPLHSTGAARMDLDLACRGAWRPSTQEKRQVALRSFGLARHAGGGQGGHKGLGDLGGRDADAGPGLAHPLMP